MCVDTCMSTDAAVYPYIQRHAYIGLYCIVFRVSCFVGGYSYVLYVQQQYFLHAHESQQHVVDVLAVASLGTCSAAAAAV